MEAFDIVLVGVGAFLTLIGGLIVFSDNFFTYMERTFWKHSKLDKTIFGAARRYNRYGRGLGSLIAGIIILVGFLLYSMK